MSIATKRRHPAPFEANTTDSFGAFSCSPSESRSPTGSPEFHLCEGSEQPSKSSESNEEFVFDDLVKRMLSAWGREKQRIANEVINRIASSEDKSSQAAWAGYLILQNGSANCIYDFVGILSRLGPSVIRDCVVQALQANGGTQYTTDDYWFALVRALGYLCRQGHTDEFLPLIMMMSRNPKSISIREAAVYALADIGDESANIRLKQMAEKDLSPIIREVAQESLEEVEAE